MEMGALVVGLLIVVEDSMQLRCNDDGDPLRGVMDRINQNAATSYIGLIPLKELLFKTPVTLFQALIFPGSTWLVFLSFCPFLLVGLIELKTHWANYVEPVRPIISQ